MPPTVRDAVLARASGLSEGALEVLETVALALPRAEPWLLEAVARRRHLEHIDECLATRPRQRDGDAVAFRHELARAAVEDAMPPTRRLALQRRILGALTTRGRRRDRPGAARAPRRGGGRRRTPCSSSPLRPLRARLDRRLPGGGRAVRAGPQGRRGRRSPPAAAPSCSRAARAPATSPTTSSRRSRSSARRSRAGREEGAPAHEARDLTELSSYLFCRGLLGEAEEALDEATRLIAGRRRAARWRSSMRTGR